MSSTVSWTPLLDAPATLGLVGLDERGHPSYAFYGEGCADRLLQPEHLAKIPAAANVFQFGSYAMVVEPTGSLGAAGVFKWAAAERGLRGRRVGVILSGGNVDVRDIARMA